jgi:hypothetical protein
MLINEVLVLHLKGSMCVLERFTLGFRYITVNSNHKNPFN